jgi:hypothetical protein
MPYKDPEKRNQYLKQWHKNYYQKHKKEIDSQNRLWTAIKKLAVLKLIGDHCIICGTTKHLTFHEIHGLTHRYKLKYYCEHSQDFITLCRTHHNAVHIINEYPEVVNYKFKSLALALYKPADTNFIYPHFN